MVDEPTHGDQDVSVGVVGVDQDDTELRQRELDVLDAGADPRDVLQARVRRAQAAQARSLEELRSVMSDEQALAEYGIDVSQV